MSETDDFGMFGDFDIEDLTAKLPKGTYLLKLDSIMDKEAEKKDGEEYTRRFKIFNFEIAEQDNPDIEDFIGDRCQGVFMNYYPGLNRSQYDTMDSQEKRALKRSAQTYKDLARAFGASEDAIRSQKVIWSDYEGMQIYCNVFQNKQNNLQLEVGSAQNPSEVEL